MEVAMSESPVQPTEADARELAAKLNELGAALPDGQRVLLERLVADAKGDDVQGFATMAEYGLLLVLISVALPATGPTTTSPAPGSGTGATTGHHGR
jgi:Flp pilus assembly pilin Flp